VCPKSGDKPYGVSKTVKIGKSFGEILTKTINGNWTDSIMVNLESFMYPNKIGQTSFRSDTMNRNFEKIGREDSFILTIPDLKFIELSKS